MSGWGFLLKGENSLVATVSIAHVLFQAIALPNKAPGETVLGALFVRQYLCSVEVSAPNSGFR